MPNGSSNKQSQVRELSAFDVLSSYQIFPTEGLIRMDFPPFKFSFVLLAGKTVRQNWKANIQTIRKVWTLSSGCNSIHHKVQEKQTCYYKQNGLEIVKYKKVTALSGKGRPSAAAAYTIQKLF